MRGERWIVVAATVAVILARAITLALEARMPSNPLLTDHDIPHYATILVSADAGVNFSRDPIFAGRAALVWRAASGYMAVFRALYLAAGRDFALALALFQLLLLAIYFPSMVVFLRAIGASLTVALAVALRIGEALQQQREGKHPDVCCGQFDGQGQSIQPVTNGCHRGRGVIQIGLYALRPLAKEGHGGGLR